MRVQINTDLTIHLLRNTLAVGLAGLLACTREGTLRIENTSGHPQVVEIIGLRGSVDVFLRDTIAQGATRCWRAPEVARDTLLAIVIGREPRFYVDDGLFVRQPFFSDSLDMSRSWDIHIHAERLVQGTPTWVARVNFRQGQYLDHLELERRLRDRFGRGNERGTYQDAIKSIRQKVLVEGLERDDFEFRKNGESQADRFVTNIDMTRSGSCKSEGPS